MSYDHPVEWTGRAHLVTTSCTECASSVTVPESNAAAGMVTCDDCDHECQPHLEAVPEREAEHMPRHEEVTVLYRCAECRDLWVFDIETGDHERATFDY